MELNKKKIAAVLGNKHINSLLGLSSYLRKVLCQAYSFPKCLLSTYYVHRTVINEGKVEMKVGSNTKMN